jgi:asparagine synthase (glutamine-hydrolysing)
VALLWDSGQASATDTARLIQIKQRLDSSWRLLHQAPGIWLFGDPETPISTHRLDGGGLIVGEVFERDGEPGLGSAPLPAAASPKVKAAALTRSIWGRYVAIFPGNPTSVFRDPLGGLECLTWRLGGVTVVTSGLPHELLARLAPPLAIDWAVIAGFVVDALRVTDRIALQGIIGVRPGELAVVEADQVVGQAIWSPVDFVHSTPGELGESLPTVVDRCVAAWAKRFPRLLAELSGGLDSAIVGAALTRAPQANVRMWVNQFIDAASGDERQFARAAAKTFGVDLHEVHRGPMRIAPEDFMVLAEGPRPTLNGSDAAFDQLLVDLAVQADAEAIITGQAGDVVFYELPTPPIVADRLKRLGLGGLSWDWLAAIASSNRISVWTVLRQALCGALGFQPAPPRPAPSHATVLARRLACSRPSHPWVTRARRVPPAKQLQLMNLAYMQVVFGASRRGRAVALLHPLLSQPVVEACLATPADILAEGGQGRGLVRRLWRGRIPQAILERRTKGDVTAFYGRAIAEGQKAIVAFLLDGRLVAQGLVDRARLEQRLQVEALVHEGKYGEILDLLAIEAWVRSWEARLADLAAEARG